MGSTGGVCQEGELGESGVGAAGWVQPLLCVRCTIMWGGWGVMCAGVGVLSWGHSQW